MAVLNDNTIVVGEDGSPVSLLAGDQVPGWAKSQVGDHLTGSAPTSDGPPPKAGKGSSVDAWSQYAEANGVEVGPDATRDSLIAALDAAGIATE